MINVGYLLGDAEAEINCDIRVATGTGDRRAKTNSSNCLLFKSVVTAVCSYTAGLLVLLVLQADTANITC